MAKNGQFDYVVHGCNCFHKMKSGIAGLIAKEFPKAVLADFQSPYGSKSKLGDWTMAKVHDVKYKPFKIVNAYTQFTYSRTADVFEYGAFDLFLNNFELLLQGEYVRDLDKYGHNGLKPLIRIGMPKIGCGLAGGNEGRIMAMIEGFASKAKEFASVTVVQLPPKA